MILRLPDGYETHSAKAAPRFRRASGSASGWRGRSIGDPFLVVLDEPNSNLDAEGEQALDAGIEGCARAAASWS